MKYDLIIQPDTEIGNMWKAGEWMQEIQTETKIMKIFARWATKIYKKKIKKRMNIQ